MAVQQGDPGQIMCLAVAVRGVGRLKDGLRASDVTGWCADSISGCQ